MEFETNIDYLCYADTFILYSKSDENKNYPALQHAATHFMEKCIYKAIALRGAISFGEIAVGHDRRFIIGKAFLDSHRYAEDQNWLGLILTPRASAQLKEVKSDTMRSGIHPERSGFIYTKIPRREWSRLDEQVHAYTFCRGAFSFECPLLPKLREMQVQALEESKTKYENTIQFIEKYWRTIS